MSIRVRLCARCRNHNERNLVKDHKDQCKYRDCVCENCILILQRQRVQGALKKLQNSETPSGSPGKLHGSLMASANDQRPPPEQQRRRLPKDQQQQQQQRQRSQQIDTARQTQHTTPRISSSRNGGSTRERSGASLPQSRGIGANTSLAGLSAATSSFHSPTFPSMYPGLPIPLPLLQSSLLDPRFLLSLRGLPFGSGPLAGPFAAALGPLAALGSATSSSATDEAERIHEPTLAARHSLPSSSAGVSGRSGTPSEVESERTLKKKT